MNCEKYLPLIDDLIEGEIDGQNAEQLNTHMFSCNECSVYWKELKQEKEIYAHYLFDVEPPADLWAQFQTKLNAVESAPNPLMQKKTTAAKIPFWKLNIFATLRLYPALGAAVVLVILGIGLLKIAFDKAVSLDQHTAQTDAKNIQEINKPSDETVKKEVMNLSTNNNSDNSLPRPKKMVKTGDKAISLNRKSSNAAAIEIPTVKFAKTNEKIAPASKEEKILIDDQANEEQLRQSQLKNLESETARQVEKTELLLRSFRNAQVIEGGSAYDVGYEKQQARKLLEQNVRLRQSAEVYGNLYARELLEKTEPLLLDIANLENNPAQKKVLDIKERVRNQNIIASLQVY
jgi:hypothetical protein